MTGKALPADWARTLVDPAAFAQEQARLAHVWTFLGLTHDLARDGDWITASLATRSVFVQRFGDQLRGFENVCAHRFHPLRTAERGNGPLTCGFHHWRYDGEGRALGIPVCEEAFDTVSRALDARLNPIEIATCGTLVFGRFPAPHATQSLEDYLDEAFAVLAALSPGRNKATLSHPFKANWRLGLHITLDDYHFVAVHPKTFGRAGYLKRSDLTYARFGLHSAYLQTNKESAWPDYVAGCRDGTLVASHYTILQILPNLILGHSHTDGPHYICVLQQIVPVAHDRSLSRAWIYSAPFDGRHSWFTRLARPITDPVRRRIVSRVVRGIYREDAEVCERLQAVAHQVDTPPRLSALEERIAWFEESYRVLTTPPPAPR